MGCITVNTEADAASRAILDEVFFKNIRENENRTQKDIMEVYDKLDEAYPLEKRTITLEYENIPPKIRKSLGLMEGDEYTFYIADLTKETFLALRTSELGARVFRQGQRNDLERIKEIRQRPDVTRKTETGTAVHEVLQIEGMVKTSDEMYLKKMGWDNVMVNNHEEALIRKEFANIGETPTKVLEDVMEGIIDFASKEQNKINPQGKVKIYFERYLPDFLSNIASTMDLVMLFSDGSTGTLDFKTVYPIFKDRMNLWDAQSKTFKLNEETANDWIPAFKLGAIRPQLRESKEIQTRVGMSNSVRINRAIPLHTQLEYKAHSAQKDNDVYTLKVKSITSPIGYKRNSRGELLYVDPLLDQIPVAELTGIKKIDDSIENILNTIHNYEIELDNARGDNKKMWAGKLVLMQKMYTNLVVDRDGLGIMKAARNLLDRYYDKYGTLKEITLEKIDGKDNPTFLSLEDLNTIIEEFEILILTIDSAGEFIKEMTLGKMALGDLKNYKETLATSRFALNNAVQLLIEERQSRVFDVDDINAMQDYAAPGLMQTAWRTLSQQGNPALSKLAEGREEADNKVRIKMQKLHDETTNWLTRLNLTAKGKGISTVKLFKNYFIDMENPYRNLHFQYTKEFNESIAQLQKESNKSELLKILKLKDDAEEIRQKSRDSFIRRNNPSKKGLDTWDKNNSFDNALLDRERYGNYYEKVDSPQYYSKGYAELAKPGNEELLEFWKWWGDKMYEFRKLAGFGKKERIPKNFLPWVMSNMIDMVANAEINLPSVKDFISGALKSKMYDQHYGSLHNRGYIKASTGDLLREIPLFYTDTIYGDDNAPLGKSKEINLLKSILHFGHAIYMYHHIKNDLEPMAEAILELIAQEGEKIVGPRGQDVLLETGNPSRKRGKDTKTYQLAQKHIIHHIYGVGVQDTDKATAKFFGNIKFYQQLKELGFSVMAPAGNFIQIKTNVWFEALKGYHFTKKQNWNTWKMMTGALGKDEKNLADMLINFIEPSSGVENIQAKSLELSNLQKLLSVDTALLGYRLGENNINNVVLLNIMQNYGFTEDGSIKRIKRIGKGAKSIMEGAKLVNGKLVIDNIVDEKGNIDIKKYTSLRNLVVGVARFIKGGSRQGDNMAINYSLLGNLFMGFKNWMPGMIDERASSLRYERSIDAMVEGKYAALLTDAGVSKYYNEGDITVFKLMTNQVIPSILKLFLHAPMSVLSNKLGLKNNEGKPLGTYEINEARAKALFESYKQRFRHDKRIQKMDFQDYLEYKQGQIRSLSAELYIILTLTAMLLHLGGKGEDDKARWRSNFLTRTLYRLVNRARREVAFFVDFNSLSRTVLSAPLPQMGLLDDLRRWWANTTDEMGDLLYGEDVQRDGLPGFMFGKNRGKDRKPMFFETFNFAPGNKFFKYFEIYQAQQEAQF